MSNTAQKYSFSGQESSLGRWIIETIGLPGMRLKLQVRGNDLRILCEGEPCPRRTDIQLRLIPALQKKDLNALIPAYHPQIYRIQLYGRLGGQPAPDWKASIHLDQLDRHLEQLKRSLQLSPQPEPVRAAKELEEQKEPLLPEASDPFITTAEEAALFLSNRNLAKRGNEMAIALYLSEALIDLGVAVQVSAKTLPYAPAVAIHDVPDAPDLWTMKRLWVMCEAPYSPESSLISEPLTQKLRDLEVEGFRDAVIMFRVLGETKTDWLLRVDLTPSGEMLRDWARWGDAEAIQRLLSQALQPIGFQVCTATLTDSTLHLYCATLPLSTTVPDQKQIRAEVGLFLEALAPQGIHAATLSGQVKGSEASEWVERLDLPASVHSELAEPVLTLAQKKDWGAIAFLLHRLLNPNLEQYLSTGGTRLQLLPKNDLLHIMSEAYLCPDKQEVCRTVTRFLEPLQIPHLSGVRIYGRRSGEKHPLWQFGSDFISRDCLEPESMPEFLATADHLNDLLPQEEDLDLPLTEIQVTWQKSRNWLHAMAQNALTRSQLFTVPPEVQTAIALPGQVSYQGTKVALVWSAIGIVLTLQTNWLLGQVVRAQPKQTVAQTQPIVVSTSSPAISAPTASPQPPNEDVFNSDSFTQLASEPATKGSISTGTDSTAAPILPSLPYTPPNPKADLATAALLTQLPLPTFNSRQIDEKIQLYYQYLEKFGTPDVLIVGSSRALRGVDPIALKEALADLGYANVKVFNFGINGATAQVVELLVQKILTPEQLPRMILWADGARALNSGSVDATYEGIVSSEAYRQLMAGTLPIPKTALAPDAPTDTPIAPRSSINQTLTESYATIDRKFSEQLSNISGTYSERDRLKNLFQQQFGAFLPQSVPIEPKGMTAPVQSPQHTGSTPAPKPSEPLVNSDGFLSLPLQFNPATYYQKYAKVAGSYDSDYEQFQIAGKQEAALQSLLQFTQAQKIPVVFVNLPLTDQYLDSVRSEYEQQFKQSMLSLSMSQSSGFTFRDLGDRWVTAHRYFSDPSHLNRYGAYAISKHLAQDPMIPWIKGKK
ncbi:MAG: hypothetical protein KME11_13600 [Timaviella obliquedivisa GSE-PSE-MK23-08B]|jgi:hypothetical protein|nr:hypothetical protein [Timaviella obliquedivisa GSE-PSE-MK23-08B]